MSILCTICARSGSKGLKNKNFLKIGKYSLIDHTIKQALKVKNIDEIIISSDFKKIKKVKNKKITYLLRPSFLSGDKVGKLDVIRHALKSAEKKTGKVFETILDLDVTSPLREVSDIKKCIKLFRKKKNNNLITICQARKNPYFNMIEQKGKKFDLVKKKERNIKRRQDAPSIFELNAAIYLWRKKYLLKSDNLFSKKTIYYRMPYNRSIDIDNLTDFKIVKYFLGGK